MKNTDFEIFPWDKNFETGITKIDEQHQVLVLILNKLAAHLANSSVVVELNKVFDELIDYTDYHFKTEEGIWSQHFQNDEWFLTHEKTHGAFIENILKMKENEANKDFDEVIYDIVLYLAKWLAYHILDTDKRMAKVVLALEKGMSLPEAKIHSKEDMSGSMQTLIQTVLKMYSDISTRTLDLMREKSLRLKAEKNLKISEDRLKFILESSNENIWDWDVTRDKIQTLKEDPQSILTKELSNFNQNVTIHPDDLTKTEAEFLKHLEGKTEFYKSKYRILNQDSSWSWILSRAKVVSRDQNNRALRIVGTNSNITQRELASIIYEQSDQAMFICDTHNNIISANPAFFAITGYNKQEVIGQNPKLLASGDMSKGFYATMWSELLQFGHWSGELTNKKKNGEKFIEQLNINVVKNEEGQIDHYLVVFKNLCQFLKLNANAYRSNTWHNHLISIKH